MPSFRRPFDPSLVTRVPPDVAIALPDPDFAPGAPIVRPQVARFAGSALVLLAAQANARVSLVSPVTGSVRNVNLASPLAAGIDQLLEVSLLPFVVAPTLRALPAGAPTFYLGYSRAQDTPTDDRLLRVGEELASLAAGDRVFIGALFQDGVAVAPWAWIELIRAAMQSTGDGPGAAEWNALAGLYEGQRSLLVLDHTGRPAGSRTFRIRIHRNDGAFDGPWTRTTGADSDLESAVAASPLDRPNPQGGVELQASVFGGAGEKTELLWVGDAPARDDALPILAVYDSGLSTAPGQPLLLPPDTARVHLQTLELARWFAPPPTGVHVARFHPNSRIEPLVDGIPTFKRIVDDMLACTGPGNGAHLAGWAFKEFELDRGRLDGGQPLETSIIALSRRLIDSPSNAGVRFLANQFLTFKQDPDNTVVNLALTALVLLASVPTIARLKTNELGYGVILLLVLLAETVLSAENSLVDLAEESKDIVPKLNALLDGIAVCSPHPATLDDNPLKKVPISILGINVDEFIDRFGTWHQKFQCFKRATADEHGSRFVAYLGGVDINVNRLDTPGHQIGGPYHDVHARITGPAAADVFLSFDERWQFEQESGRATLDPAFDPPLPAELETASTRTAGHIVQIARTHYRRADGTSPFAAFAPQGERTIHDTLVRAILAARDYIHIEDQYVVPNDRQNPAPPGTDLPDTYVDALITAAQTCKRLVMVMPSIAALDNQPFSRLRRDHILARLRDPSAWGGRALIGAPMRRPVLPRSERLISEGRCVLLAELDPLTERVIIGPRSRVPASDLYWLWIDGELMIATGAAIPLEVDGKPAMEVKVLRGQTGANRRWGASTRAHHVGAPVTMSRLTGIFVHAKIMVIDDVFVSIGSANLNRRGFFYDGEINVFAVPQHLAASPENPARALRAALWAEHLNLPPAMGPSLLRDPLAAFELFRRTPFAGNRFMPLESLDLNPDLAVPLADTISTQLLGALGLTLLNSQIGKLWDDASDATSFSDPDPTPGPFPGF